MKWILMTAIMICALQVMSRQTGDPGLPGEDPDLPLDGGITILFVAGAIYGIRKIYAKQ